MNMQTFNAMRSGAKAMQDARGRLDVDQVDDVMDDIKDEMDIAEQVSRRGWRPQALSELDACQSDCFVDTRSEYPRKWKAVNSASRIHTKCFGDLTLSVVRKSARCEKVRKNMAKHAPWVGKVSCKRAIGMAAKSSSH